MNLRITLYELASAHRLAPDALDRLQQLAGLGNEPASLRTWLPRVIAILAAALGGFGVILWVAANWDTFGRFGRFALLQGVVLAMCAGAFTRPGAHAPFGLLALLGIGGLFAYFGQTYQTGADPWQLFALWALLALPLCLGIRSDVLWAPWALVAMTTIPLWIFAHAGHRWRVGQDDLLVHGLGWLAAISLTVVLSRLLQRYTGAGIWSMRTAVTLSVVLITFTGIGGLFHSTVAPHYVLALFVMAGAAAIFTQRAVFDVFALSAVALGLNVLLVGGLARLLFGENRGDAIGTLFMLGLAAAGLLAASVNAILRLAQRNQTIEHMHESGDDLPAGQAEGETP